MGIEERREREKQQMRQGILEAARQIARQVSWAKVTIRRIAEEIEYSPPTIYEHFESKEALLKEIAREGFRRLLLELRSAQKENDDPEKRFLDSCRAYWRFAVANPEFYEVMHLQKPLQDDPDKMAEAQQVFDQMGNTARELLQTHPALGRTHHDLLTAVWGLLHGLLLLSSEGRIEGGPAQAEAVMEQTVQDLLCAWRG